MPDVVVLGSLNMDLVVRTERMPRPGETLAAKSFVTIPGGKGANQAAAASRLGATAEMIGCVGEDAFGPVLLQNLNAQGVGTTHVRAVKSVSSGVAVIIVDASGENSIVVAAGANDQTSPEDVDRARTLLEEARYLVLQLEIPLETVAYAVGVAESLGLKVILNAAPAHPVPREVLGGVQYLIVNEHEVEFLTGIPADDVRSAERAGQALLKMSGGTVIVTIGAKGALLVSNSGSHHVPARQVQVVDTTAAGDAFVGGFAVALLKGLALEEAVRYATCAGTLATTKLGAQTSLPSAVEVEAFYREA